ncbi:MAG TPA: hypothetical protein VG754_04690 [Verrucomicrobiae bacterium]|nr:hypothetical protein [Verrucomicrobiae bacterium]
MSLKAFHLVFIVASILLAVGFAAWEFVGYFSPHGGAWDLVAGIGGLLTAIGLVFYERYFLKKTKNVSYL